MSEEHRRDKDYEEPLLVASLRLSVLSGTGQASQLTAILCHGHNAKRSRSRRKLEVNCVLELLAACAD